MRMIIYQGIVAGKVIIGSIETKVGIGDGGTRHIYAVNDFLKERGGALVRGDVVNDEEGNEGKEK